MLQMHTGLFRVFENPDLKERHEMTGRSKDINDETAYRLLNDAVIQTIISQGARRDDDS
jgi:hypothetical protein